MRGTINAVCEQYAKFSPSEEPALPAVAGQALVGWVPLKGRDLKREGEASVCRNTFRVFHSRPLRTARSRRDELLLRCARELVLEHFFCR